MKWKTKLPVVCAVGIAASAFLLSPLPANAQWQLRSSQHEPCWSIANPVNCSGRYRPENPIAHELFRRDPAAAQSYWVDRR